MIVRRFPQRTGWQEVKPYSDAAANVDTTDPNVPNALNKKKYVRLNGRIYEKPVIPPTESPYERRRREIVENFSAPTLEQEVSYEQQVGLQNQARVQDFLSRGQTSRTVTLKEAINAANAARTAAIAAGRTANVAEKEATDAARQIVTQSGLSDKEVEKLVKEAILDSTRDDNRDLKLTTKFEELGQSIQDQINDGQTRVDRRTNKILLEIQKLLNNVLAPQRTASGELESDQSN